ncbi:hypothetical protein D9758_005687 [Tetrapyrgos nigripes]|uniref:LysM domain-containing protein n=1 Tax=Tetrapyrgos nigripes TaxID=182062 RepID=A0A8H5GJS3_9AGAR|nr:hypothetical protein D9758_005687 [Tetrapyrgos nigripes]
MAPSLLSTVVVLCSAALSVLADSPISPGFSYGSTKVRGVNLGGWLVLEPWMTPSMFDSLNDSRIIDEWTFAQYQSKAVATLALTNHWNTWITEQDFIDMQKAGLNHVRIPIGYWAFDVSGGEPFIQGQIPYLQNAVAWAKKYGLKVIVDLHGAPGSQNGFDNSGQSMSYPQWQTKQSNINRTKAVLATIAKMFKDQTDVVTSIQPLNEPAGYYGDAILSPLKQYYYDSYGNIRFPYGNNKQGNALTLLHDAFQGVAYWNSFMPAPQWQGVAIDTHIYQIFSDAEIARTNQQHIDSACSQGTTLSAASHWAIVGEWTPAMTDCASWKGVSRYDGTYPGSPVIGSCKGKSGKASTFSPEYKTFLRQSWEAQTLSYEKAAGWIQWSWKLENSDDWSYQAGLQNGWIPWNPDDRKFPQICSPNALLNIYPSVTLSLSLGTSSTATANSTTATSTSASVTSTSASTTTSTRASSTTITASATNTASTRASTTTTTSAASTTSTRASTTTTTSTTSTTSTRASTTTTTSATTARTTSTTASTSTTTSKTSTSASSKPTSGTCPNYTVVAGDYCWLIANNHGTTVAKLQAANPNVSCNPLRIGQVLNIPC